jgi:SPP1 family phage portal protein
MSGEMQRITEILEQGAQSAMTIEDIIRTEIDAWLISDERKWMQVSQRYYRGKTDILARKREVVGENGELEEVKNLANNKLVHNFVRKLVDQKVGYLLSKPLSIQTDDETYADLLSEFFDKSALRLLQNTGKDAVNKGKGWIHVYYNETGELSFMLIPAEEGIPFWKDAAHTELDAFVRIYDVETYEGKLKKDVTKVEFWDTNGVRRYTYDGGLVPDVEAGEVDSHFSEIIKGGEVKPLNWERVPFICFKYNSEEQGIVELIKSLVDEYDVKKSDNSNNLEDLPNSIYVVKNYDGTNLGEFRKNLSAYRAVKVTDEGGVDTISLEIDTEAFKTHMEMTRKDIYEFGRGVDTQSKEFGNSPSGIALRFLYADLDMDADYIETEFQASLEQLRWFIDTHIANTMGKDYSDQTVDFLFNRDILINETETVTNAKNSVGIISDETIAANHPWTTDTQDELDRLKKQRKEDMKDYPGLGKVIPPGDDDE